MKVAVLFDRFSPYHVARLSAASQFLDVVGVELSAKTTTYAWDRVETDNKFERVTVVPDGDIRDLHKAERRHRLVQVLNKLSPDVVAIHGWSAQEALIALVWCNKNAIPIVMMSESTAWDFKRAGWREAAKRLVLRSVDTALVGGTPHVNYLHSLGFSRDRIFLGYDAVDNSYFNAGAKSAKVDEKRERERLGLPNPFFLASSRFVEKKNLQRLVVAFAEYRQKEMNKAWDLVLLGDGALRNSLETQRNRLELGGVLHLPGFKQYWDLPSYYGLAGAFVHASTTEQWGLVVNEAMASGLPVLVSRCCGCAKDLVIEARNGFTFDPYNTAELTTYLLSVTQSSTDRQGMGLASQEIISHWSPERFAIGLRDSSYAAVRLSRLNTRQLSSAFLSLLAHVR